MEYRSLEKLGIKTSLLGYGCMRFPRHRDGSINYERSEPLIDLAYQNGVNYFDTAYNYHNGESEIFTGKALEKYDRSSYYLATKLPFWLIKTLDDAKRIFQEQLDRLHKDYIDFYLLHSMGRESFDRMAGLGVLEYLDQMKAEGKIRYLGFSFHDTYEAFSYILNYRPWDFCQIQLNYMDTEIQAGIKGYELTEKMNVPLIIMEPVKGGSLAKLPQAATKYFTAAAPEKSIASWALRWVASLPNVKVVLSGMSNVKQVSDNLETFGSFVPLSESELQAVASAAKVLRGRVRNGCTGCSYCMPCPSGVNIPENFSIWNEYGMFHHPAETKWYWTYGIDDKSKAKNCAECGQCEDHCPQKLTIRENLKQLQAELDAVVS
jgi:predicted aldo/keto reductase-like oxidoreductase